MSTEQPSSIERTGSKVYRYFVVVLTLLVALYLIIQGAKLLSLGGTSYYLIAGIAMLQSPFFYAMKKSSWFLAFYCYFCCNHLLGHC